MPRARRFSLDRPWLLDKGWALLPFMLAHFSCWRAIYPIRVWRLRHDSASPCRRGPGYVYWTVGHTPIESRTYSYSVVRRKLEKPLTADGVVAALHEALSDAEESPALPRLIILHGETGRGKTYAVQKFFEDLSKRRPGYWEETLVPSWPPTSRSQVDRNRKRIQPERAEPQTSDEVPFYWAGNGFSGASGSGLVGASVTLEGQLHDQFSPSVLRAKRNKGITLEAFKLAVDAVGQLIAPIGLGKTIVEHTVSIAALARSDDDVLLTRRRALSRAFSSVCRIRDEAAPLILVLDDAQDAGFETLFLASGLVSDETPDKDRYFPNQLTSTLPGPMLIVCTVWQHRISGGFRDPFQLWLDELRAFGIETSWIQCEEFTRTEAQKVLESWGGGVDEKLKEDLLSHIGSTTSVGDVINPLVLTSAVGQLEEARDPFAVRLEVDEADIQNLPKSPTQHIQDRLERLREEREAGKEALALLVTLCNYAPEVPERLLEEATKQLDALIVRAARDLLSRHGLIAESDLAAEGSQLRQLRSIKIDPDVHRYITEKQKQPDYVKRLVTWTHSLMNWAGSDLYKNDLLRPPLANSTLILSALRPAMLIIASNAEGGGADYADAALVSNAFSQAKLPFTDSGSHSTAALAFAYARGHLAHIPDETIMSACHFFGVSTVTARIAGLRLSSVAENRWGSVEKSLLATLRAHSLFAPYALELTAVLIPLGYREEAATVLRQSAGIDAKTANRLATLYEEENRIDEAIETLLPMSRINSLIAKRAADLLVAQNRITEALNVLEPLSFVDQAVAMWRADVLVNQNRIEEAILGLRPLSSSNLPVAIRIANLLVKDGRMGEAISHLMPLATHEAWAAAKLSDLLRLSDRNEEAFSVLMRFAAVSGPVSIKVANLHIKHGRTEEAITSLRPLAAVDARSAVKLAIILSKQGRTEEAVAAVQPLSRTKGSAAYILASLLQEQGRDEEAMLVLSPLAPKYPRVAIMLSAMLIRRNRISEAMDVLGPTARKSEYSALQLAKILISLGRLDEVTTLATRHVRIAGKLEAIMSIPAGKHQPITQAGRPMAAKRKVRAPKRLKATESAEVIKTANGYIQHGVFDEAVAVLAPHATASNEQIAIKLAMLLSRMRRIDEGIELLAPLADSNQQIAVALASLLAKRGWVDDAVKVLRSHNVDDPAVGRKLAVLLVSQHKLDEAIEILQPWSEEDAIKLAELLIQEHRVPEALKCLEPHSSSSAIAGIKLSGLLIEAGRKDEAIHILTPLAVEHEQAALDLADLLWD